MAVQRNLTGQQFGSKIKELFNLIETIPNWEIYVSDKTEQIIKTLYANKNMTQTLNELDLKYTTVRAHLVRAVERIKSKRVDHLRKGQSRQAQQLFELMNKPNWEKYLTDQEVLLANRFKTLKNFYAVGRELNLAPGNIAATLYGNTQKLGVVNKLKKQLK